MCFFNRYNRIGLENWDVSKAITFSGMFCNSSLLNLKELINWNVSSANNFAGMFNGCKLLSDIKGLKNWNVSNGNILEECLVIVFL